MPSAAAARAIPSSTPSAWSAGVVGALAMVSAPVVVADHHVGEGAADVDADGEDHAGRVADAGWAG